MFRLGCGDLNPRAFSMTPLREDMDFNVPRKVGIAIGTSIVSTASAHQMSYLTSESNPGT